jgi:hypothetical protein
VEAKEKQKAEHLYAFTKQYPTVITHLYEQSASWPFAQSILDQIKKGYDLSDKQLAVVYGSITKEEAKAEEKEKAQEMAPILSLSAVKEMLDKAHSKGVKSPKMRIQGACFIRAKDSSSNPNCLYVKDGAAWEDTYLGKVTPEGKFLKSWDCTEEQEQHIIEVGQDAVKAAKAYGQKFGNCSFCGRGLTTHTSIALSYGPTCADNYGLPHDRESAEERNPEFFEED